MKKPKIKKRGGVWFVYTNRKQKVKCLSIDGARLWYNVLVLEQEKRKKPV